MGVPGARAAAMAAGEKTYWTGQACPKGHVADRFTQGGRCVMCARAMASAWAKANPDRARERARRSHAKNQAERVIKNRLHRQANPGKNAAWRKTYYERNKAKHLAGVRRRQAALIQRLAPWADLGAIEAIYIEAARISKETGIPHHVDHVIPLQGATVSGLHVETNLEIITATRNLEKGNAHEQ